MKQFIKQRVLVISFAICLALQLCMATFTNPIMGAEGSNNNILLNTSFEEVYGNSPTIWQAYGGWNTNLIRLTNEEAYSGQNSVVIEPNSPGLAPWVGQMVKVVPGATYELSAWLKSNYIEGAGAYYKVEFYKDMAETVENYIIGYNAPYVGKSGITGDWQFVPYKVKVPENAIAAKVYIRVNGLGKVYWDELSFKLDEYPPMMNLSTDDVFYYTDITQGKVKVVIKPFDGIYDNKFVDIRIFKQSSGEILKEGLNIPAQNEVTFDFDPRVMSLQDEYTVEASFKTSEEVLETQKTRIFRWERPLALNEKNEYIIDGKPFFPVIMYHVSTSQYALVKDIGVNTVQGLGTVDENTIRDYLDKAQQNGIKVVVPLYAGMKVKENFEYTRNIVTKFKDHPAVLAWAIMDEPSINGGISIIDELVDAYRIIRSIDSVHPTYIVECSPDYFDDVGKTTDVLLTDSYPLSKTTSPISTVGEYVANAKAAVSNKPVWTILQAFRLPPYWPYLPNIDEVRNMAYQAIIEGAQGLGFYSLNDPGWNLSESELWDGLKEFKEELNLMGNLVLSYEKVDTSKSDIAQWAIWKNGQDYYASVLNLTSELQNVTIPLDVNGYKAELLYGEQTNSFGSLEGELQVQLQGHQALLYKITPFMSFAEQAGSTLDGVKDIIENQYWNAQINMLAEKLRIVKNELITENSNMKKVIDDAANILRDIDHLKMWVYKQSDFEEKKEYLINALSQAEQSVGNISKSLVQLDVEISDTEIIAGEQVQVNVKVQNNGMQDITNSKLTLGFSEELGMPNDVKEILKIKSGEIIEEVFYFNVPKGTPVGTYSINLDFDFEHHNILLFTSHSKDIVVSNLVDTSIIPVEIRARKNSDSNLTLKMINNASIPVDVMLDIELPEGMSMDVLKQITIGSNETRDIEGTLHVTDSVSNGSYEVWIVTKVNGEIVSRLPLRVIVDNNLVINSGFEEDMNKDNIPDAWMLRKGIWVQDTAKSGKYAVSILPDSNNSWNVINTDISKRIVAVPGTTYQMKIWAKNASAAGGVFIGIRESNSSGGTIRYLWVEVQKNSDWTQYELTFTASPTTKYIEVYLKSDQLANGQAWFDDVYIEDIR